MLIHKATMGILIDVWTGQTRRDSTGQLVPIYRPISLCDFPDLNAEEWWELPNDHPIAGKLKRYYPWLTPIISAEGALVDVIPTQVQTKTTDAGDAEAQAEAARRGYKNKKHLRPLGMFQFLQTRVQNDEKEP